MKRIISKKLMVLFYILSSILCTNLYAAPQFNIHPEKIGRAKLAISDSSQHGMIEVQLWYPVATDAKATPNISPFKHAAEAWNAPVAEHTKLPLIVISHGWGGSPDFLAWFADSLASNGFFVAIPQHIS